MQQRFNTNGDAATASCVRDPLDSTMAYMQAIYYDGNSATHWAQADAFLRNRMVPTAAPTLTPTPGPTIPLYSVVTRSVGYTMYSAVGLAVDLNGVVFSAVQAECNVQKIVGTTVTTVGVDFWNPTGVAVDRAGNIFVADSFNSITRRIDRVSGVKTNVARSANLGFNMGEFTGIALDSSDNLFVAGGNKQIQRVDAPSYTVATRLGTSADPMFKNPHGLAIDASGNVYVADRGNNLVRRIEAGSGIVTSLGTTAYPAFKEPAGVAVDAAGNVFLTDYGNDLVRRIDLTGAVTDLATSASPAFYRPFGITLDVNGNIYMTDSNHFLVRKIAKSAGSEAEVQGGADGLLPVSGSCCAFCDLN